MDIHIERVGPTPPDVIAERRKSPAFGKTFSDRMFVAQWHAGQGWHDPRIVPYGPLQIDPAANVLHYAQEVFEGQKAYYWEDGRVALFRPQANATRFDASARRMCMPTVGRELYVSAVERLVWLEREWIPRNDQGALYIRPTMIATEPCLGVRVSDQYLFYVIVGPVGPYFKTGFKPVSIRVERDFIRAAIGGIGAAKTSGNYAASLLPGRRAIESGCNQVLFLDARERRYLEELGGMNIFCRIGETLVTPPLTGSILPGVTRDSILKLAPDHGFEVEERMISIEEVRDRISDHTLDEMFAVGTAAVVTAIGSLLDRDERVIVGDGGVGEAARTLYDRLSGIQRGREPDPHGWVHVVAAD